MIIKRWDGAAFEELYPKTLASKIYEGSNTIFDINNKIKPAYLPDVVFDSLKFYAAVSSDSLLRNLANNAISITTGRSVIGLYWVASTEVDLTANSTALVATATSVYYITRLTPGDGTEDLLDGTQTLEAGDWFIITDISGTGTNVDPYLVTFAAVNNTYELATTTVPGIVKIGSDTMQSVAGNSVTETSARTYFTQKDTNGRLVVNVPWTDTIYTHPTYTYADVAGTEDVLSSITLLDSLTVSNGHVTNSTHRKLVAGTNVSVTPATNGNITIAAVDTTYTAGNGLDLTGTEFSHEDTSTQASVDNTGLTFIQDVTLDTYGHITALGSTAVSAGEGVTISGTTIRETYPLYVQTAEPTTTVVGAIWYDIN